MKTKEEIYQFLDNIQFLSPNEPITPQGIERILNQMAEATSDLGDWLGTTGKTITMWDPNLVYAKDDIVLYFKEEPSQVDPSVDKREFAFILISTKKDNISVPNYELVDGIPDFTKTNWSLLNPMSYLLQNLIEMKKVVKEVFQSLLDEHVKNEHGLVQASDIGKNLLRKDYTNLTTKWDVGHYSLNTSVK